MCYDAVPDLRAAAALSVGDVRELRSAGLRSLPTTHGLRRLASWARRSWRTSVRVHALRALVRSPAALAHLSPRAQDILFAVFRTVNGTNRDACAKFFGPLLLAEDPWVLDTAAADDNDDARSASDAFVRLYDARHQFLGNIAPGAAAFAANPDLLHRESDALRRHLGQTATAGYTPGRPEILTESAPKARRLLPTAESPGGARFPVVRSQPVLLHPPDGVDPSLLLLEERVTELRGEVEDLRKRLQRNERYTKYQQSLIDLMAKLMFDTKQTSLHAPANMESWNRAGRPMDVEAPRVRAGTDTSARCDGSDQGSMDTRMRGESLTNAGAYGAGEMIARMERFRSFLEESPWREANGESEAGDSTRKDGSRRIGRVRIFRNGQWVERGE